VAGSQVRSTLRDLDLIESSGRSPRSPGTPTSSTPSSRAVRCRPHPHRVYPMVGRGRVAQRRSEFGVPVQRFDVGAVAIPPLDLRELLAACQCPMSNDASSHSCSARATSPRRTRSPATSDRTQSPVFDLVTAQWAGGYSTNVYQPRLCRRPRGRHTTTISQGACAPCEDRKTASWRLRRNGPVIADSFAMINLV